MSQPRLSILLLTTVLAGCGLTPATSLPIARSPALAARDAGTPSVHIENFGQVSDPGHPDVRLFRGGIPGDQGLQDLKALGVKTVVCLLDGTGKDAQVVSAEQASVAQLGLTWVNLTVPYGVEVPRTTVNQFLAIATDPNQQGVYVHCKRGKDRTGEMVAAYRIKFQGYSAPQAIAEMQQYLYKPGEFPWVDQFVTDFAQHPN